MLASRFAMNDTTNLHLRARSVALLLLRVIVGLIMVVHGWMKLTNIEATASGFADMGIPAPEAGAYLAVCGELLGGLGIIVGLLTPIAALGVLCVMLTAIGFVHLPHGLLAQNNGFEYPLTIAAVAGYLMVRGAGPISLDAWWAKRRHAEERRATIPGQHPSSVAA